MLKGFFSLGVRGRFAVLGLPLRTGCKCNSMNRVPVQHWPICPSAPPQKTPPARCGCVSGAPVTRQPVPDRQAMWRGPHCLARACQWREEVGQFWTEGFWTIQPLQKHSKITRMTSFQGSTASEGENIVAIHAAAWSRKTGSGTLFFLVVEKPRFCDVDLRDDLLPKGLPGADQTVVLRGGRYGSNSRGCGIRVAADSKRFVMAHGPPLSILWTFCPFWHFS